MNRHIKVVVNVLLSGLPVKLGQYTYMMGESTNGKQVLCLRCWKDPDQSEVLIQSDISVNEFLRECENLTDEEAFVLGCEKVLTDINRKGRP